MSCELLDVRNVDGGQVRPAADVSSSVASQVVCDIESVNEKKFDIPRLTLAPSGFWADGDSLESPPLLY